MIPVREDFEAVEYEVVFGKQAESHWIKKLKKTFKKTVHTWEKVEKSMVEEYRFFDTARLQYSKRYNVLSASESAAHLLVKHELKISGLGKSASGSGFRVGLFVEVGKRVTILFVGHHKHFDGVGPSSDKECFKLLLKNLYPEAYKKFAR